MRRSPILLAAAVVLTLSAAACGDSDKPSVSASDGATTTTESGPSSTASAPAAESADVVVKGFKFTPGTVTVKVGGTVTWKFDDGDVPHNATADDGTFKSEPAVTNGTFSFTFDQAGTHSYKCTIHPNMTGKVVVE